MIVEIFISSLWRRLIWRQGDSPVVRNEYEPSRLFQFVSPMVSLNIYDREGKFRQGGSLEIQKDQEVRVFSGSGGIEIFKGVVDRDIQFSPADETLRFKVVGWLARIKRYLAGRRIDRIVGDDALDSGSVVIGSITDDDWGQRYLRDFTVKLPMGEDVAKVEVIYPNTYKNLLPENLKVGLRKESIFDSRLYDSNFNVFQTENEDPFVFTQGDIDGVFTRNKIGGFFKSVDFSVIVTELIRQLNIRLSGFESNVSLGEISGDLTIRLIDNVFGTMDYFTRFIDNETRIFMIGWGTSDGLPLNSGDDTQRVGVPFAGGGNAGIGAGISVYNVINKFRPIVKNDGYNFSGGWEEAVGERGYPGSLSRLELDTRPTPEQRSAVVTARVVPADNNRFVAIYMLWSWLDQIGVIGDELEFTYHVQRKTLAQWLTFDLVNGNLVGGNAHYLRTNHFDFRDNLPALHKSAIINNIFSFERGGVTFSFDDEVPLSVEMDYDSTHYSIEDGVPFASGNITLDSMQFDFHDAEIVTVFLEICKLTNSILYIDKDKVIHLVSRDFSSTSHDLRDDVVIRTTSQVTSNFGDRVPQINSQIIVKESHRAVLRDFYADQEFPNIEDVWKLTILENDVTANIKLLDTVKFPKIGFGANIAPAIVRSMEYREGEIAMTVSRAQ